MISPPVGAAVTWTLQPPVGPVMSSTYPPSSSGPESPSVVYRRPRTARPGRTLRPLRIGTLDDQRGRRRPGRALFAPAEPAYRGNPSGRLSQIRPQSVSV